MCEEAIHMGRLLTALIDCEPRSSSVEDSKIGGRILEELKSYGLRRGILDDGLALIHFLLSWSLYWIDISSKSTLVPWFQR